MENHVPLVPCQTGQPQYPWANTGHVAIAQAPVVSATSASGESANSSQVSAMPVATGQVTVSIWWPTDEAAVTGYLAR